MSKGRINMFSYHSLNNSLIRLISISIEINLFGFPGNKGAPKLLKRGCSLKPKQHRLQQNLQICIPHPDFKISKLWRMDNCDLDNLAMSEGKLNPSFRSDITQYTATVESSVETTTLHLQTSDCGASCNIVSMKSSVYIYMLKCD